LVSRRRIFRALTIGIILSLLVIVILPSPALAIRDIELDPDEGRIGDNIDVDGKNWPPSDPAADPPFYRYVDIYFTSDPASIGHDIDDHVTIYELAKENILVDTTGNFSARFGVPSELTDGSPREAVRGGVYYVCVTYGDNKDIKAVAEFTVAGGEITTFSPKKGPVGTEVDISGKDFGEREDITILYDGDRIDIKSGDDETDSRGRFDCTIVIPPSTAGKHTVTIQDETLSEVEETFTVEPEISLAPAKVPPGDKTTVSGTGFGNRVDVEVFLDGQVVAAGRTSRDGSLIVDFVVPDVDEGPYEIEAEDDDGNDAKADFTVEIGTQIDITPITSATSPGYVGQSVTVSGVGFNPNAQVTITYATEPRVVGTPTTDAEGSFSHTFKIPKSQAGAHTIAASDGTNSSEVAFYMESQAPATPKPLLPKMNDRVKAQTEFDWEDVKDDSGVTYELQVATSKDFTASSMVLEMIGLAKSEYTLTKPEALPSSSAEKPYYWRVRAVDGAQNQSDWSVVNAFYVRGFLQGWALYIVIAIVAILLLAGGILIGMRIRPSSSEE